MDHLYFRTEGSPSIGLGHLMRCYAIGEEARHRDIAVTFLLNDARQSVVDRLTGVGAKIQIINTRIGSVEDAAFIIHTLPLCATLVVDTYAADSRYLKMLYDRLTLVFMDDLAELSPMPCRMVINASIAAFDLPYERIAPEAIKLLGPDYAQIRREFTETLARPFSARSIAVMFGGSDPKAYSLQTARQLLNGIPDMAIKVVAGPALQGLAALYDLAETEPRLEIFANPPRVAEVLAGSSLVITAAGGSIGEIAAMGLMALVIVIADNQKLAFESCPYPVLDGRQALPAKLVNQVTHYLQDQTRSAEIARQAKTLIDGKGCARILESIAARV